MSQVWLPLERSQPDLRLWSLDVVALTRREDEEATQTGGSLLGRRVQTWIKTIRLSVIRAYNARSDHFYTYLGI